MKNIFILIILIFCSLRGFSQNNLVGKQAPKIDIENWIYPKIKIDDWVIKEVPKDLKGKIIVLDFWFTHCAPCVASIPELNHLAKLFPEVVFLSVTFDKPDDIDIFLDKMVMYYPIGSDPKQKTIGAYGVSGFPETFLIDRDGIVRWQGSPFQLDKRFINKLLGKVDEMSSLNIKYSELPFENSAYSFTIHKNYLEMGQSSYYHFNPFDINIFNKDLEDMLIVLFGINKSRIFTKDSLLLKTTYDVTLKANKDLTTQANCIEMLKYLLPEQMGFELKKILKDTIVYVLQVKNDSLLNTHKSDFKYLGTTMRYNNWESKGANIKDLKDFLENNYLKLISVNEANNGKFDFVIPAKDFEEAKKTLENDYGIILKSVNQKTVFWRIIRKKNE